MAIVTIYDPATKTTYTEEEYVKVLRKKYTKKPPIGYTAKEIESMSDEDLLDMDYFLNE